MSEMESGDIGMETGVDYTMERQCPTLSDLFERVPKSEIMLHVGRLTQSNAASASGGNTVSNDTLAGTAENTLFMAIASEAVDYVREKIVQNHWDTEEFDSNVYLKLRSDGRVTLRSRKLHVLGSKLNDVLYALLAPDEENEATQNEQQRNTCEQNLTVLGMWQWNDWLQSRVEVNGENQSEAQAVAACLYAMVNLGVDYELQTRVFDGKICHFSLRDQMLRTGAYNCDGCGSVLIPPVNGQWRCQHCNDYDLCTTCYTNGRAEHAGDHVFACLTTFEEQSQVQSSSPATGQAA